MKKTPLKRKEPKPKVCKYVEKGEVCNCEFMPMKIGQKYCIPHLIKVGNEKQINERHKELKEKVRSSDLKTRKRAAKEACHEYIRLRDAKLPCISCGTTKAIEWHASHFHESGNNPGIRYNEMNIHLACIKCNTYKHGNLIGYRKGIIERYGRAYMNKLEEIKLGDQKKKKWSADELRQIEESYKEKIKELTQNN